MIINYVKIKNFRGIHQEKRFDLGKKFVLLSAANGVGKTTVMDAIEWALTGSIGRLKAAFSSRSTNETERKSSNNLAGILKNKDAKPAETISVELEFVEKGQTFTLKREQCKDGLIGVTSKASIIPNDPGQQLLDDIAKSNFYTYHFCDIQKSLNLQATKREDFSDLFKDFIADYSTEEAIAANLELFVEDLDRYLEDLKRQASQTTTDINTCTEELQNLQNLPSLISYPAIAIYSGEQLNVQDMTEEQLQAQMKWIFDCGYQQICNLLTQIKAHRQHQQIITQLSRLLETVSGQKEQIARAISIVQTNGSLANTKKTLEGQISHYNKLHVTKDNLSTHASEIIGMHSTAFTQEFYDQKIKKIGECNTAIESLEADIAALTKGNRILAALSSLLSHKDDLIFYKNQRSSDHHSAICPVCGSATFGTLADDKVLLEAENYADDNTVLVTHKKEAIQAQQQIISAEYDVLIQAARSAVKLVNDSLQKNLYELGELEKATDVFFKLVSSLQKDDPASTFTHWADANYIQRQLQHHKGCLLSNEKIKLIDNQCQELMHSLNFPTDAADTEESLLTRIPLLIHSPVKVTEAFTPTLMANKISSVNSMLHNQRFLIQSRTLKQLKEKEKEIQAKVKKQEDLKSKADKQMHCIRTTISELQQQEYESLGPNLYRLYKKLARVDSIQEIRLSQDQGKMVLVDEKGKNIVNILSNGQLGVFMLSYFFAGLLSRKDKEPCKVYFIDDLTACMDDVNMLSFLDLMKYQMQEENLDTGIDQMFFATCDYRVCELLRYKLSGSQIPYCELTDKAFDNPT